MRGSACNQSTQCYNISYPKRNRDQADDAPVDPATALHRFELPQTTTPAERVALAMSLCSARGAQLTQLRRQILELLWGSGRPTGAHELIEALTLRDSRPVGPPTVYRAPEFLMSLGLVSRIRSRSAYVPCAYPQRRHDCLFFICSDCGASTELEDLRVVQLLAEDAAGLWYRVTRCVVEVEGTCASCIAAAAA